MKRSHQVAFFLIGGLILVLTACSGSASGQSSDFAVTVTDNFAYSPSTFTVNAGQGVTITFVNEASVEHTLNILKAGGEIEHLLEEAGSEHGEEEMHAQVLLEIHSVQPGATETVTFTAPTEPGEYLIFCSLPGHFDAGMSGTLHVNP